MLCQNRCLAKIVNTALLVVDDVIINLMRAIQSNVLILRLGKMKMRSWHEEQQMQS